MVDHPPANNSINETKDILRLPRAIRDQVEMVEHDHIRENEKTTRQPCLVDRFAGDRRILGLAKDRQTVLRDRSQVVRGRVL